MIRNFISKLYSLYMPSFFMSGGGSAGGYVIERSLRFSAASSQYLSRTPVSSSNRKTWTWSGWVKRGALGTEQTILGSADTPSDDYNIFILRFTASNTIRIVQTDNGGNSAILFDTTDVFRDTSAHHHVMLAIDTTQATGVAGVKLYVNGVLQTGTFTAYTQNYDTSINSSSFTMYIGRHSVINPAFYFDGYQAEDYLISGQALTPSFFGEINQTTGQWVAKKYTGTYGVHDSYLDFKDGTSTTTLGYDKSGNNNHWTLTNFTRAAGVNDCWMLDVPAGNGSASAVQPSANYPVWNVLNNKGGVTLTKANLNVASSGISRASLVNVPFPKTGKWYWEVYATSLAVNGWYIGVCAEASFIGNGNEASNVIAYAFNGNKVINGSASAYGATYGNGVTLAAVLDNDLGQITFYKDNVSQGAISFTVGQTIDVFPYIYIFSGNADLNCGQRSFVYTPPAGAKALCTANLTSTDVIESGSFTGNASADGSFIWCNGTPETLTINGNAVTWGTHADKLANGFKIRTSSSSYNSSGTNTWTATILSPESKSAFKHQNAKGN